MHRRTVVNPLFLLASAQPYSRKIQSRRAPSNASGPPAAVLELATGASASNRETPIMKRALPAKPKSTWWISPGLGSIETGQGRLDLTPRQQDVAVAVRQRDGERQSLALTDLGKKHVHHLVSVTPSRLSTFLAPAALVGSTRTRRTAVFGMTRKEHICDIREGSDQPSWRRNLEDGGDNIDGRGQSGRPGRIIAEHVEILPMGGAVSLRHG